MTAGVHQGIPAPLTTAPYVATGGAPQTPAKLQWSAVVVAIGCVAMFVGLVVAISGMPGKLSYNVNGAGARVKNTSHDPLKTMSSMDSNIKWVEQNTESGPGQLNYYLTKINTSEIQIGVLSSAVQAMTASVIAIDENLQGVAGTTTNMNADMKSLATTSTHSSATMSSLGASISGMGSSLSQLSMATKTLGAAMTQLGGKATKISHGGTDVALRNTSQLNAVLPASVPRPETSLDAGSQQGMQ